MFGRSDRPSADHVVGRSSGNGTIQPHVELGDVRAPTDPSSCLIRDACSRSTGKLPEMFDKWTAGPVS
jgi:hypothetical protein